MVQYVLMTFNDEDRKIIITLRIGASRGAHEGHLHRFGFGAVKPGTRTKDTGDRPGSTRRGVENVCRNVMKCHEMSE